MIGQFVMSKAGHDKGTLYVIVAEDRKYVFLSDGKLKSVTSPKKKSRKHIQPVNACVETGLREKLMQGQMVQPEQIRFAIRQFNTTIDQ